MPERDLSSFDPFVQAVMSVPVSLFSIRVAQFLFRGFRLFFVNYSSVSWLFQAVQVISHTSLIHWEGIINCLEAHGDLSLAIRASH